MSTESHSVLTFRQKDVSATEWRTFRSVILDTIEGGVFNLVVVLDGIEVLFSGALNALVEARVKARERGGAVVLVVTHPELTRLLSTTGFDKIFDVVDTREQALARFVMS